jgi:hypothetical protein
MFFKRALAQINAKISNNLCKFFCTKEGYQTQENIEGHNALIELIKETKDFPATEKDVEELQDYHLEYLKTQKENESFFKSKKDEEIIAFLKTRPLTINIRFLLDKIKISARIFSDFFINEYEKNKKLKQSEEYDGAEYAICEFLKNQRLSEKAFEHITNDLFTDPEGMNGCFGFEFFKKLQDYQSLGFLKKLRDNRSFPCLDIFLFNVLTDDVADKQVKKKCFEIIFQDKKNWETVTSDGLRKIVSLQIFTDQELFYGFASASETLREKFFQYAKFSPEQQDLAKLILQEEEKEREAKKKLEQLKSFSQEREKLQALSKTSLEKNMTLIKEKKELEAVHKKEKDDLIEYYENKLKDYEKLLCENQQLTQERKELDSKREILQLTCQKIKEENRELKSKNEGKYGYENKEKKEQPRGKNETTEIIEEEINERTPPRVLEQNYKTELWYQDLKSKKISWDVLSKGIEQLGGAIEEGEKLKAGFYIVITKKDPVLVSKEIYDLIDGKKCKKLEIKKTTHRAHQKAQFLDVGFCSDMLTFLEGLTKN